MQQITPSAKIDKSSVKLSADASWLVCERICIPGSAKLNVDLPIASANNPANQELFARWRRLLPQNLPETAKGNWSRIGSDLRLSLTTTALANYPTVGFFPLPPDNTSVGHPTIESRSGNEITFHIPIQSANKSLLSMEGLLVFGQQANGEDRAAWQITNAAIASSTRSAPARGIFTFLFFGFVQHAGQSRQKILRSGIAFAGGIFTWFIALAALLIALKAAGREITWGGLQFTNAYFVLFLSVIVLVFALNLFGVFEISLPQSATRGLLGWTGAQGEAGSFFQGVFATVLATPCTAPFLGTALGFAFAQSPAIILSMFVAIAAGMSAPYLLLCAQPP